MRPCVMNNVFADDPVLFGIRGASPGSADVADEAALVEASTRGLSCDVEAQPLVRGEHGGDSVEEGGLSRTGQTRKDDELVPGDIEGHVAQIVLARALNVKVIVHPAILDSAEIKRTFQF